MYKRLKTPMVGLTRKMLRPFLVRQMSKLKVKEAISKEMLLISWACKPLWRDRDLLRLRRPFLESLFTRKEFKIHTSTSKHSKNMSDLCSVTLDLNKAQRDSTENQAHIL
jgi:hypothetical protein